MKLSILFKFYLFTTMIFSWQASAMMSEKSSTPSILIQGMVNYNKYVLIPFPALDFKNCCSKYLSYIDCLEEYADEQWFVNSTNPKKLIRYSELNTKLLKSRKSILRAAQKSMQKNRPQIFLLADEVFLGILTYIGEKDFELIRAFINTAKELDILVLYPLRLGYVCPTKIFGENTHETYPNLVFVTDSSYVESLEEKKKKLSVLSVPHNERIQDKNTRGKYDELCYVAEIAGTIKAMRPELSAADIYDILLKASQKEEDFQAILPNGGILDTKNTLLMLDS